VLLLAVVGTEAADAAAGLVIVVEVHCYLPFFTTPTE
jgi:hypothetical protein